MYLQIIPIHIEKEIVVDDDLSQLILTSADIQDGDILVIAQKLFLNKKVELLNCLL